MHATSGTDCKPPQQRLSHAAPMLDYCTDEARLTPRRAFSPGGNAIESKSGSELIRKPRRAAGTTSRMIHEAKVRQASNPVLIIRTMSPAQSLSTLYAVPPRQKQPRFGATLGINSKSPSPTRQLASHYPDAYLSNGALVSCVPNPSHANLSYHPPAASVS